MRFVGVAGALVDSHEGLAGGAEDGSCGGPRRFERWQDAFEDDAGFGVLVQLGESSGDFGFGGGDLRGILGLARGLPVERAAEPGDGVGLFALLAQGLRERGDGLDSPWVVGAEGFVPGFGGVGQDFDGAVWVIGAEFGEAEV